MAVWCRQTSDGEVTDFRPVAPHADGQTDAELLDAKRSGATSKGWTLVADAPDRFTVRKDRWGGTACVREFWID